MTTSTFDAFTAAHDLEVAIGRRIDVLKAIP